MKRLERLGSVAFVTVLLSLVFHLLGMSFNRWKDNTCTTCDKSDPLGSWSTTINQRCYQTSMASIFLPTNQTNFNKSANSFITEICIPNQYLMAKDNTKALECLNSALDNPDVVCTLGLYDKQSCKCDYTINTKIVLALTILAALSLGVMLFFSHIISFVKIDYVLRWLIPTSFSLLSFAIVCLFVILIIAGTSINEDVNELRYSWSLFEAATTNQTELEDYKQELQQGVATNYSVKLGWCFGMEIMSLYFATVSLVIYGLIFLAKQRPEPKKK